MPRTAELAGVEKLAIADIAEWATASAAFKSLHWASELPNSTNIVGTLKLGP